MDGSICRVLSLGSALAWLRCGLTRATAATEAACGATAVRRSCDTAGRASALKAVRNIGRGRGEGRGRERTDRGRKNCSHQIDLDNEQVQKTKDGYLIINIRRNVCCSAYTDKRLVVM